jgi:hypothetical protein
VTPQLATICQELGITVVPVTKQRGLMETHAVNTLARILETRPPEGKVDERAAHLRSVLLSIVETENNKRMLVAPVIWAVSDILLAHPSWFGGDFLEAMDKIDLAEMHDKAKANRKLAQPRQALVTMLMEHLGGKFEPEEQARLI